MKRTKTAVNKLGASQALAGATVPFPVEAKTTAGDEQQRVYHYPSGDSITVRLPVRIDHRPNGAHQVLCADGLTVRVRPGWSTIAVTIKEE
jgi:hypothetical protein